MDSVHKHDILLVMGDLNAKVGEDNEGYENIIGSHGLDERNDNGERLVDFCELNNQIGRVLLSMQHRISVMDTRAMRGADIASDHQ